MLKIANLEDLELVSDMALSFSSSIAFSEYTDAQTVRNLVESFLTADNSEKVVFLHGDEGMLAAVAQPFLLGTVKMASEIAWWVKPESRGKNIGQELVEVFEAWAKKLGCPIATMACYDEKLGKFYEKNGYKLHELAYIKEL